MVLIAALLSGCGGGQVTSEDYINLTYRLGREYTGAATNDLTIELDSSYEDLFTFSVSSLDSTASVPQDTYLPLVSQVVTFTHGGLGIHQVDFKVKKANSQQYIFEVLAWESSDEIPDPPIISFAAPATNTLVNLLQVSDSRISNTEDLWLEGDLTIPAQAELDGDGYWQPLPLTTLSTSVTLTAGDGLKVIDGKFRNIFGNVGNLAVPAEIILKQTPPTNCDAEPLNATIANNLVRLRLSATDPYPVNYSVFGDVGAVVSQRSFNDGDTVDVYVEPTPGPKTITVYIEDIAGNVCLTKSIDLELDPIFQNEALVVQSSTYWTETENILVDATFDHYESQEPLQLKFTGSVSGANTNAWVPYTTGVAMTLNPTTSGSRTFFAQYKDVDGVESYLIAKRIFLKPTISSVDAGAPFKNIIVSNILDATSITVTGCNEVYNAVAYQAAYLCEPNAPNVTVTYSFPDGPNLVKTVVP